MSFKIHVSSDTALEDKKPLMLYLEKVLKAVNVPFIQLTYLDVPYYGKILDSHNKVVDPEIALTNQALNDKFLSIEVIELNEHPEIDPPKCDCY